MNQIKRLVFFGCSVTYGKGLDESTRLDEVWTKHLCDNLGVDHLNLGLSGCSNHDIYKHIQRYLAHELDSIHDDNFKDGDFIIIALTGLTRQSTYYEIPNESSHGWQQKFKTGIKALQDLCELLEHNKKSYLLCESFVNYHTFLSDVLDSRYTKNFLCWGEEDTTLYDLLCNTWGKKNDDDPDERLNYEHLHDTSDSELFLPCSHPSPAGHEKIAEELTPIISEHLAAFSDK